MCSSFDTDYFYFHYDDEPVNADTEVQQQINNATRMNRLHESTEEAGRAKVIEAQLDSGVRAVLAELQGVNHSVYSEIDPLYLPEVLALICRRNGRGEFHLALSSSIVALFATVNMKECILQERAHHAAIVAEHEAIIAELDAKLAAIDSH